uniref:Uncharacterized protein n=1 Tax=Ascaris lumbricoides TaxID=6252 RepID=A0A0M3ICH6_ASCLU
MSLWPSSHQPLHLAIDRQAHCRDGKTNATGVYYHPQWREANSGEAYVLAQQYDTLDEGLPPRRAFSSVVAPSVPDLYSQFRVPSRPMFTSSQHDSSALIDNYPAANYHPSMQNNNRTEPRSTFQRTTEQRTHI